MKTKSIFKNVERPSEDLREIGNLFKQSQTDGNPFVWFASSPTSNAMNENGINASSVVSENLACDISQKEVLKIIK